jgi:regulator of protease activity HflC (stomatin/prohibitin superfamily)
MEESDWEKQRRLQREQQAKAEEELAKKIVKRVVIGVIAFIAVILFFSSMYIINAGETGVVVTLGRASDIEVGPGLHVKIPIFQSVIVLDTKVQKDEVTASAASRDLQTVSSIIAVNYRLESSSASSIYKEVGVDYINRILSPAIQEATKAATAQYTAEELITKREQVRETIRQLLRDKVSDRGIVVEDVLIINFDFSDSFNQAIEAKVTAEQNALAAKNKLAQVEYEAQQEITAAKGKAEAQRIQIESLKVQGGAEYVQLQAIAKWNGQLPTMTGGTIPFVNIDNTN